MPGNYQICATLLLYYGRCLLLVAANEPLIVINSMETLFTVQLWLSKQTNFQYWHNSLS